PIAGPGHAALEAIGYTFLRPGDRIVVVSNGFFGDRTHEVLLTHRVKADLVSSAWGSAPDLAALRTALKTPAKAVVVVHNETSTTISSNLFYAFHRALKLLREEGLEARFARHAKVAARLRAGLAELGFRPVGPSAILSNTVGCFTPPPGVDPARLVRRLKDEH